MKRHQCSLVPALIIFATVVQGLLVIGPQKLRTNRRYTMVISNFLTEGVDLSLKLTDSANGTVHVTEAVDVLPSKNQLVEFDVPDGLEAGGYTLILAVQRGFTFHEEIKVYVDGKSFSGLIQLDKPVYKPGETVNFRVIVLDSDLKPPKNVTSVSVVIENSKGLKVRKWDAARLQIGVFEGSFPIASSPELGTYNVIVKSGDEILVSKTFEVKEFVLSSFDVDVFPTTVPLEEHQGLNLTIAAKNVFGKPVNGKVDLTLFSTNRLIRVKATRQVDGVAQLEMRFNRQLFFYEESEDVNLNFTFTEQYTNRSISKSLPITVYKSKYIAKLIKETPEFLPGILYKATVKVEHRDGSPANFVNCEVEVDGLEEPYDRKFLTDDGGEITLELMPSETETISITVSVGDHTIMENTIEKAQQNTEAILKIALRSRIHLLLPIRLQVTCRRKVKFLAYFVLAKGNVIEEGFISSPKTRNTIIIKYSDNMVPKVKVLVATVIYNIVVYDMMDITFPDLQNNFDMEVEHKQVKPGEQIQLTMIGRPGSYVALAGYDKSLLQYGSTQDLRWSDVQELYESFHGIDENQFDIFQKNGLFARVSVGYTLDTVMSTVGRGERFGESSKRVPVRTDLVESFLWRNATMDKSGRLTLKANAPNMTTSWCLTGFSMDPEYGLGIIKKPLQLITVKEFYIVDHLPYSIKQDEEVELLFTIFNNLGADYDTNVTLLKVQDQFEFFERSPNGKFKTKTLVVKQAASAHVSFLVKAKKLGEMVVRVQADNGRETDIIEKVIQVMPKSLVERGMDSHFFCYAKYSNETVELKANIDKKAHAIKITFSVEPNLRSAVMEKLEKLIDIPIGSGESNMINFVPHVAVLDYISAINPFHPVIEATRKFLRQGYQNQLKYRLADGSFKDFEGTQSSIFLTAFVAKSLQNAAKYLPEVDPKMVYQAYEWLATKQHSSGRFDEVGPILLQHLQTNARKSVALTSYVLIAFLENPNTKKTYSSLIEKGIDYVSNHANDTEDSYDLAIATYAISLHNSESNVTASFRDTLIKKSKMDVDNGEMHWPRETHSIETTAYALLAIMKAENLIYNKILIMRWLIYQRHVTDSFSRTQDTFVGLQALGKLFEIINPERNDYTIVLNIPKNNSTEAILHNFGIGPFDTHTQSITDIPGGSKKVRFTVIGTGCGLVSLKYSVFSLDLRNYNQRSNLTLVKEIDANNLLVLKICASFSSSEADERSGMALVEVNFPSGYEVDNDPISKVTGGNPIKKEIRFGATSVVLYYENMGLLANCFVVTAYRRRKVNMRRPAYVIVQDFYNPHYNAIEMYYTDEDLK